MIKKSCLLLMIDFEKAFDSVSWKFIEKALNFFNFGSSIINWVRVFQKNITSAINQGGNFSSFLAHHHEMVGYSNRPASVVRPSSVVRLSVNNSCYRYFSESTEGIFLKFDRKLPPEV